MNQRTARLLFKIWKLTGFSERAVKKWWYSTPRPKRAALRRYLEDQIFKFGGGK